MLTREAMAGPRHDGRYRLLFTNDGSAAALDVVRAMRPLLSAMAPEVILLRAHHVLESQSLLHELASVEQEFPEAVSVTRRAESLGGSLRAADLIVQVAQEVGADAIAMSTHGHSARRHLFAGSVTLDVLGASPVPVIVARAE
jgi:nucleotide-binding universal stress UspA family protein